MYNNNRGEEYISIYSPDLAYYEITAFPTKGFFWYKETGFLVSSWGENKCR